MPSDTTTDDTTAQPSFEDALNTLLATYENTDADEKAEALRNAAEELESEGEADEPDDTNT